MINHGNAAPLARLDRVDLPRLRRLAQAWVREPVNDSQPAPPIVIALCGTLGAGKTRLTQELSLAMGIDVADVTSPTFTLVQTHRAATVTLHHLDAYRIADPDEFWQLGIEDLWCDPDTWTVVEWADRVAEEMPWETVWVRLTMALSNESPSHRSRANEMASADDATGTAEAGLHQVARQIEFWCAEPTRQDWIGRVIERVSREK